MARTKTLGLGLLAALVVTGGVVAIRTVTFSPADVASPAGVKLAATPPYNLQAAATNLGQAIRFQTISHQNEADNKREEWSKLQAWLKATYPAVHAAMKQEITPSGTLIYSWVGSDASAPGVIVMAHQDVVPVTPGSEKDWKYPPFEGRIAENAVWGRGAVDDKGALVCLFEALDALAKAGFAPKRTVYLVSGHDEEVGGNGAKEAAALMKARGIKAWFTVDEGSAIIQDMPLTNGPAVLIGVAEKGYATLKVTAPAVGGHSSMPPRETGAVNLAKAILAINGRPWPLELKGPGTTMLESLAAAKGGTMKMALANQWLFGGLVKGSAGETPSGAAMLHTTIAPTMLEGSPKENVLPQSANALINYRIAPWNTSAQVLDHAKQAVGKLPVTFEWVKPPREPSRVSSATSDAWKIVAAAGSVSAPSATLAPYLVVGGTDSRSFEGISQDVYRFMPMHFTIKSSAMIHGTNEHMSIDNLKRMIDFYAQLIATASG